jgi:hypothetical protein
MNRSWLSLFLGAACLWAGVSASALEQASGGHISESTRKQLPRIAFIERPQGALNGTSGTMFAQVHGRGASIWVWDPQNESEPTQIFQTHEGMIFDISPSYDGQRLVMAYRERPDDPFHIWEIRADGSGLRQITSGRYHDFNPVYYPDGRIVFSSSRVEAYSMCQDFLASALFIMKGDGSDIRRIDWTTIATSAPSIMPDGSILCTRWEYQDKNIFSWQTLWTIKPSGRQLSLYYGNTLTIPNCRWGGKAIPGTDQVIFTMAAHHYPPIGDIAIVDHHLGLENPAAARQITFATNYRMTQGRDWKDDNWEPGDRHFPNAYTDPWPINKDLSLVSFGGRGDFQILALYHDGKTVPVYGKAGRSFYCPVPLAVRPKPLVIDGDAPQEKGFGTFYVQNVYEGLLEKGVKPGQVKSLRIWEQVPKKYNTEGPRVYDHYPLIGFGTYYVKVIHGTVPVSAGGTAYFKAPSNAELYFQALDAGGKEIIRMGSVTQITTGEVASCTGCHENRMAAPSPLVPDAERLRQPPDEITPPSWGAGPVDYVRMVQPILDQYCIKCHSGFRLDGDVDLSGDKNRFFSMSYSDLCRKNFVDYHWLYTAPTGNFPAFGTGSWTSRLTKLLESKHGDVDVDAESRKRIYAWIDSNVCYYATWDMCRPHSAGGRDTWTEPGTTQPMPWLVTVVQIARRRNLQGLESGQVGGEVTALSATADAAINLTHPENSRLLSYNLAIRAGGKAPNATAPFKTRNDPDYLALLNAIHQGAAGLQQVPRIDMPGVVAVPQQRDFGRTW